MTLLLSQNDVVEVLDLVTAVEVTRAVFLEQARGEIRPSAPGKIALQRGSLRIVSGAMLGSGRCGVRAGVNAPVAILYDNENGELLSILAYPFSSLRLGATVALVVSLLARAEVENVAIVGTGRNAPAILEGVCWARPGVRRISVFSRAEENRRRFAREMSTALMREVVAADSIADAIQRSEVVLTATNPTEPVLYGEELRPGQLVVCIGRPNELAEEVYEQADMMVVTSREHELNYYDRHLDQPFIRLLAAGKVVCHELGQLLSGQIGVPTSLERKILIVRESQGGFGDVALANWAFERAKEKGLGQSFRFM